MYNNDDFLFLYRDIEERMTKEDYEQALKVKMASLITEIFENQKINSEDHIIEISTKLKEIYKNLGPNYKNNFPIELYLPMIEYLLKL